jgi:hypothetical protein
MSSPVTQIEQVVVADKVTKTRQPTLPDKYGKFIQFAYYMMENVLGNEFQMDKEVYLEKIKLFGNVGEQQVLVQGFLNSAKDTKKTIKKVVSDRKKAEAKANKPPRPSRAKAAKADGEATAAKRSRKKATKEVVNAQDELLNDLVQLARAEPVVAAAAVQAKSPEKVAAPVVATEPVQTPEKAAAEKLVKTPKAPKKAAKKSVVAEDTA